MAKYHVYGIGNALVDLEFEVTTDFLQEMEITKGVMSLVDEKRQNELLHMLAHAPPKRACGGSAANTLMAVTQLGGKCFYSCKVGNDEMGQFYDQNLRDNGVKTLANKEIYEGTTGKCLVLITPDADRTMNTFLGITQTYGVDQVVEEELAKADYLYIEGYLVSTVPGRAAMAKAFDLAKKHGVKVALSLSDPFIVKGFHKELMEFIEPGPDFIFCNEKEAQAFGGEEHLKNACQKMKHYSKAFAITLGSQGSLLYDGSKFIEVSPYSVHAKDTNGAGDMFAGALLYGLTHGMSYALAGDLASLASAKIVSQFGPRLTKDQTQNVLHEILNNRRGA